MPFFLPASLSTHAEKCETVMLLLQFPKHQKLDVKVKSANPFTVSCLEPTFHHFTLETANVYSKCVGSSRNLDPTFCQGKAGGGKVERFLLILRYSTDSQQILADRRLRIMTMFSSVTRV